MNEMNEMNDMNGTNELAEPSITFDGAGKRFGDTWVLEDIEMHVPAGTIVGLIGPSGSGKTTIVRLANGVYRSDSGSVRLLGADPAEFTAFQRRQIGYLPQHPVLFDELSLWENLNYHASLNGVRFRRRARLTELLDLVELGDDRRKLVREASGGMQRRLALAAAMVHRPAVLMLDEPTAGIDPILRRRFWEHFRELRDAGTTLVISTQYVNEAADCDSVGMLARGRVAAFGTPGELKEQAFGERPADQDQLDGPVDWDDVFIELVGADASDDVDSVDTETGERSSEDITRESA